MKKFVFTLLLSVGFAFSHGAFAADKVCECYSYGNVQGYVFRGLVQGATIDEAQDKCDTKIYALGISVRAVGGISDLTAVIDNCQ